MQTSQRGGSRNQGRQGSGTMEQADGRGPGEFQTWYAAVLCTRIGELVTFILKNEKNKANGDQLIETTKPCGLFPYSFNRNSTSARPMTVILPFWGALQRLPIFASLMFVLQEVTAVPRRYIPTQLRL